MNGSIAIPLPTSSPGWTAFADARCRDPHPVARGAASREHGADHARRRGPRIASAAAVFGDGFSPGVIGLIATAEALGFLVGCLYAHKIIAPVGLERAYAAFAGMKAVAILGTAFRRGVSAAGAAAVPDRIERRGIGHHRRELAERARAERAARPSADDLCARLWAVLRRGTTRRARISTSEDLSSCSSPASRRRSRSCRWWASTCARPSCRSASSSRSSRRCAPRP